MTKWIICFAAAMMSISVYADDESRLILGAGNASCGTVMKNDGQHMSYYTFWVQGYLSGINSYVKGNKIDRKNLKVDADALALYIKKYCLENPLDNLESATMSLVVDLYNKAE